MAETAWSVERKVETIYNTQIHAIIDFISNAVLSDCFAIRPAASSTANAAAMAERKIFARSVRFEEGIPDSSVETIQLRRDCESLWSSARRRQSD